MKLFLLAEVNLRCSVQGLKQLRGRLQVLVSIVAFIEICFFYNSRCNGIVYQSSLQDKVTSKDNYHHTITAPTTHKLANKLEYRNVHNNCKKFNKSSTFVSNNGKLSSGNIVNNIKSEVTHSGILQDFEDKIAIHSIIGECATSFCRQN